MLLGGVCHDSQGTAEGAPIGGIDRMQEVGVGLVGKRLR